MTTIERMVLATKNKEVFNMKRVRRKAKYRGSRQRYKLGHVVIKKYNRVCEFVIEFRIYDHIIK